MCSDCGVGKLKFFSKMVGINKDIVGQNKDYDATTSNPI